MPTVSFFFTFTENMLEEVKGKRYIIKKVLLGSLAILAAVVIVAKMEE